MEKSLVVKILGAIKNDDGESIKSLLTQHPEQKDYYGPFGNSTWLCYAARYSSLGVIKTLIDIGLDVNKGDKQDNQKPITYAASGGRSDVVAYLLSQGAILDTSLSIRNPLFAAIVGRSPETVKLLLEAGIDTKVCYNSKTMKDMDAVAFASMQGELECARMIALWNANGDETLAQAALVEAERIAYANAR